MEIKNNDKNTPAQQAPAVNKISSVPPLEDSFLFAPPVQTAYMKIIKRDVYWLNGTSDEHNVLLKLTSEESTRQQGFEKAVYHLACDEHGEHLFKDKYAPAEFSTKLTKNWLRSYGCLILGFDDDGDKESKKSAFDQGVADELKKSKTGSESSTS